jgi:N-acetylglucosaminyldiphosphoundecaprenol N-acetyl-beta-D-mannosaminyltransferase
MSVVWAARRNGIDLAGRMTAADFFPEYLRRFTASGRRVFLLGGAPGVAERAVAHLHREIPEFEPAGWHHGYLSEALDRQVIDQIQAAKTDILLVGMGSPQQERWIAKHRTQLNVPLVWAVGALFDYSAGVERRCPKWMGNSGLEWLYRLGQQPRKMAARYLLGNPKFVWQVLWQQWKERRQDQRQQTQQSPLQRHRRRPR